MANTNGNGLLLRGDTWHMRFSVKGTQVAESTHTSNRREAEQILARRKSDLIQQIMLGKLKTIKLHDAINQFQKSRQGLPSTNASVRMSNKFRLLPNVTLDRLTSNQVQSIIDKRIAEDVSKATVNNLIITFNAMVNHFAKAGYSVCDKVHAIRSIRGRIRWLSDDEETRLFAALDPYEEGQGFRPLRVLQRQDNRDLYICLRHTGARYAEIANLQWTQVDFKNNAVFIHRGKGSNDSTITLTRMMREVLDRRRLLETGNYVFSTKANKKQDTGWIVNAVKRAKLSETNGRVTCHTLRHTAATKWLQGGMNPVEVQQMLGHKSILSTMIYVHLVAEKVSQRAADIIDELHPPTSAAASSVDPEPAATGLRLVN